MVKIRKKSPGWRMRGMRYILCKSVERVNILKYYLLCISVSVTDSFSPEGFPTLKSDFEIIKNLHILMFLKLVLKWAFLTYYN